MGPRMSEIAARFTQLIIALDQLGNCIHGLFFGGAFADETWSARCWRENRTGWIRFLDLFERDHCFESYTSEQLRLQSPPEER